MYPKRGWGAVLYGIAEIAFLPALFVLTYWVVVFVAAATDTLP